MQKNLSVYLSIIMKSIKYAEKPVFLLKYNNEIY